MKGASITVHATGSVEETGKKFWSTKDPGQQPFTYHAGVGGVITGWDQGCMGMSMGEVRKLRIPADEGYGAGGFLSWIETKNSAQSDRRAELCPSDSFLMQVES